MNDLMQLPNGEQAIVEDRKLVDYLLNEDHEEQPGHAILFRRLLGIDQSNFMILKRALLGAAVTAPAAEGRSSTYGRKYEIRFPMTGPRGTYTIMSVWLIESGAERPRLVTAYVE